MAGAAPEVDNILRFEHDFPGATVIRLERNYRSTGHILGAASHLIAHNEGRLGKTLRTEDEPGEKVGVTGAWDSEEEARSIGEEIENLQREGHFARRDGDPGARLVPDARIRGSFCHARPALSGHRGAALLRARRNPRCAGVFALW
jgi:superfamily I DNA/RNA helicase